MPKVMVVAAIILGVAVTAASAASKHRRSAPANPPVYNASAGGVSTSTACLPSQSPCRTQPDTW
jgi:hypothetical protein